MVPDVGPDLPLLRVQLVAAAAACADVVAQSCVNACISKSDAANTCPIASDNINIFLFIIQSLNKVSNKTYIRRLFEYYK